MCLLVLLRALVQGQSDSKEHQLKAEFLYRFTMFVQWSSTSFDSPEAPIVIGVLGSTAFAGEVERAIADRKVNARALVLRRVRNAAEARGLHLLFIGDEEDRAVAGILAALRGASVLTVGESPAFARAGGMITFVIEKGKVRFDINKAAAERASLRISSQLQKLARTVSR